MSNKAQPRSELRITVPLDVINKNSITAYTTRVSPPGPTNNFTYNNQILSEHNRSAKVKVIPDGFYRRPAPYRVFALKVEPKAFSFGYTIGSSQFVAAGMTDRAAGFGGPFYGYLGTKLSGGLRVPDVSQNRENQVIAEAKNKLLNGDLNLLTSLAEAKEAFGFAAAALKSIADLMRRFLSSQANHRALVDRSYAYYVDGVKHQSAEFHDVRDAKSFGDKFDNALSDAESAWLSTMYGMMPLISDYLAFIEAAKQKLTAKGAHISVLRTISWPRDFPGLQIGYPVWEWSGDWHSGCECQLTYRMADPYMSFLTSLGLTNPLSVFWEVTPYSFVVDWLIPISNWIQSLTADVGMVFQDGFVNTKNVLNCTFTCCNYLAEGNLPTVSYKQVCQFRYTLVTSPLPGLYIKSPFTSAQRAVSAIALAAQLLR